MEHQLKSSQTSWQHASAKSGEMAPLRQPQVGPASRRIYPTATPSNTDKHFSKTHWQLEPGGIVRILLLHGSDSITMSRQHHDRNKAQRLFVRWLGWQDLEFDGTTCGVAALVQRGSSHVKLRAEKDFESNLLSIPSWYISRYRFIRLRSRQQPQMP